MHAHLTDEERLIILQTIAEARNREVKDELDFMSPAELCGYLDISPKTLWNITDLPRVTVVPNKVIRYRRADVREWIMRNRA